MSDNPSRHVAYEQVKLMLDFMGQHVDFATGQLRSLEARHVSKRLWSELTQTLNSCRGTRKNMDGWSRYWSDFKNKLKNKVRIMNKRKRLGSIDKGIRPLTKLEKRAVVILGPCFEKKVFQLAQQDYQDESVIEKLPKVTAEVKIESIDGPADRSSGRIEISPLDAHVALSPRIHISPDRESEEDAPSDYEYDDSEHNAEPLMSSLYPKWLIDIEQKRAEAELSRARAEESRARVAASAAQAATIQAEALRTLAEAASKQADAVARIAATLDTIHKQRANDILGGL
ncbi:uncharacterized protein LOC134753896 [Cydia strobilella]|uniref:uncharacterized protein LOC134753896 n=1 Tax=Cydia strobilella TaxID=1100964 RepID=UPI003007C352